MVSARRLALGGLAVVLAGRGRLAGRLPPRLRAPRRRGPAERLAVGLGVAAGDPFLGGGLPRLRSLGRRPLQRGPPPFLGGLGGSRLSPGLGAPRQGALAGLLAA